MAKYRVYFTTTASLSVDVEVDDDLTGEDAHDAAIDRAYDEMPSDMCAQCSGWRTPWSREFGEWEVAVGSPDLPAVERIDGEVTSQ